MIDQATINVGDTVRLVGDKYKGREWSKNLTHGNVYVVHDVSREELDEMPIMVINDKGVECWLFAEDLTC